MFIYHILLIFSERFQYAGYRNSGTEVFCKLDAYKKFANFTGKHLCQSSFFNKVADLSPATLLKKDSGSCEFCGILRNTFFYRTPLVTASVLIMCDCRFA